ncbi:MAG: lipase family protein [Nitrospirae bacterium]|nr:lipase family protein [Nitrospirota bacterium]
MKIIDLNLPEPKFRIVAYDEPGKEMVGAVADGAARVKLQLIVDKKSQPLYANLSWKIADYDLPNSPIGKGTLLNGDVPTDSVPLVFNADGVAEAIYRAPDSFVRWGAGSTIEGNDKKSAERKVRVILGGNNSSKYNRSIGSIRLKRPPVVLVHGLWGDGRQESAKYSWKEFEPKFNQKTFYDIVSVDYHETNADNFASNARFVRSRGIDRALGLMTDNHFAAAKVDIIGNSMGGLLPREYCRNNSDYCAKHIRKFITTDTPHLGSELANLIQSVNLTPGAGCYNLLLKVNEQGKSIWSDSQHTLLRGALVDLSKGSPALSILAKLSFKAIVGSALSNVLAYDISLKNMWIGLVYFCGYQPDMSYELPVPPYVATPMFLEDNDRVVSVTSQKGTSDEQYRIFGVDHLTVLGDPRTATKIQEWLEKP